MKNNNSEIIERFDKLNQILGEILLFLKQGYQPVEPVNKPRTKQTQITLPDDEDVDYWLMNRHIIKKKFKLVSTPQFDICIKYKNTGNDRLFDPYKKIK